MIRKAEMRDMDAICQLALAEYLDEGTAAAGMNFSVLDFRAMVKWMLDNPNSGHVLVAVDDSLADEPIGMLVAQYQAGWMGDPRQIFSHEIGWYVLPEYRGRGHGKALQGAWTDCVKQGQLTRLLSLGSAVNGTGDLLSNLGKYRKDGWVPFQVVSFKVLED